MTKTILGRAIAPGLAVIQGLALVAGLSGCSLTDDESAGEELLADEDSPDGESIARHRRERRDLSASTTTDLEAKRYVASGNRAYVIGAADGGFDPMGWHIRGEMGGVWAHPIKLLDGYWFSIDGEWLPAAERYTTSMSVSELRFPEVGGLSVKRTEFAPDGSPVVLVRLELQNRGRSRQVELGMDVRSELMGAYPWGWTTPNARDANGADTGSFADGRLVFAEPDRPWQALVGASPQPDEGEVGDDFWGPVPEAERPGYLEFGNGTGGHLRWSLRIGAGRTETVWIAVAGSHIDGDEAERALEGALDRPESLLEDKVDARRRLLRRTRVSLPDETLELAFDWAKLNMADLRRTVVDAELRDVDEGRAFPAPVAELDSMTGVGAGFPDYPWLFGTDGAYTSFPLVVSGQWDTAMRHLRAIRDVSVAINGDSGKVVHEVVTDGSVYFGANHAPGNSNETAQFAVAVDLLWRWTGDDDFADEMLPFVTRGLQLLTDELDGDSDRWPEGFGMVERGGMGSEKLDVTSYTWAALRALEHLAAGRGDEDTAASAAERAASMEASLTADWWMPEIGRYADSLCNEGDELDPPDGAVNVCTAPDTQLQQEHWINATPMEMAFGPTDDAIAALEALEEELSGPCGLFHTGPGGGPNGAGELKCWTLPTSVMAVAEANYGRLGPDQALRYIDAIAGLLDLEMPGALPEIAASPEYDPFADFRDRAMFMQAWSAYGVQWPVVRHFLGVDPDVPAGRLSVVPHIPDGWPGLAASDLRVGDDEIEVEARRRGHRFTTRVEAPDDLELTIGHTLPAGAEVVRVELNGDDVEFEVVDTTRGREVHVAAPAGCRRHTLEIKAR